MEMVEYIKREAAIRMLRGSAIAKYPSSFTIGIFASADELEKLPAADVAPVRHGKWRYYHKQNIAVCTECSFERNLDVNFGRAVSCPNCGAMMDLGDA